MSLTDESSPFTSPFCLCISFVPKSHNLWLSRHDRCRCSSACSLLLDRIWRFACRQDHVTMTNCRCSCSSARYRRACCACCRCWNCSCWPSSCVRGAAITISLVSLAPVVAETQMVPFFTAAPSERGSSERYLKQSHKCLHVSIPRGVLALESMIEWSSLVVLKEFKE